LFSLLVTVLVTLEYFDNLQNIVVGKSLTVPCTALLGTAVVWYYQPYCSSFENGIYFCSNPVKIVTGNEYGIVSTSLHIYAVSSNMTGLYTCKVPDEDEIHYSCFLHAFSKYFSALYSHLYCQTRFNIYSLLGKEAEASSSIANTLWRV